MNHKDALTKAATLINQRGSEYGPEDACFDRSAKLASIVLNKTITKYDVAMILAMNKMARLQESRSKDDHYIDAMNYMAFASQFSGEFETVAAAVEDDVKAMASKLAPDYFRRRAAE